MQNDIELLLPKLLTSVACQLFVGIVIGSGVFFKAQDILNYTDGNMIFGISIQAQQLLSVFSLVFTIASEDVDLLDYLYIDTIAGTGFSTSNSYHKFIKLSDAEQVSSKDGVNEYIVRIYSYSDEITIPKSNNFVELDCSFYFDQEATAEFQAKTIKTMAFRLE